MAMVAYNQIDPFQTEDADIATFLGVWESLRGEKEMPDWADFDWFLFPTALIPYITMVDATPQSEPLFRYRFWGTAHQTAHGCDYTGRSPLEIKPSEVGQTMQEQFRAVYEARRPLLFVYGFARGSELGPDMNEASLRLPFTDGTDAVGKILAFADFRRDQQAFNAFFELLAKPV